MVVAVGIDWESASMEVRELFAIPKSAETSFMEAAIARLGARGCVLLKTCNRFEAYFDMPADQDYTDKALLVRATSAVRDLALSLHGETQRPMVPILFALAGAEACRRLMTIACGLRSQVLGEDQIISQVRRAQTAAREAGCITPELETLFRLAVTCGKAVRTRVQFHQEGTSCARTAIDLAERELEGLRGLRALVIGNGEMGRLAAELLVARGADTAITLRTYRHGITLVPRCCKTISYDDRMSFMEGCDLVVSATRSQHITVSRAALEALATRPRALVDLAMPRDIELACGEVEGVRLFDLDDMRDGSEADLNASARKAAHDLIEEHLTDFEIWCSERARRLGQAQAISA